MGVLGYARCEQCKRVCNELVTWPNPIRTLKLVCRPCYRHLRATSPSLVQSGEPPLCPDGLPSLPIADGQAGEYRRIPQGCEKRFEFTRWRIHRGTTEPLRNRIIVNWPEGVVDGRSK